MNAVAAIAAKEIREGLRNRWIVATTLLLGALALTLSFLGSAPTGTVGASPLDVMVVSLSSLTIFLIPLIALLLSHDAIVGESERGTLLLLLAYPVRRARSSSASSSATWPSSPSPPSSATGPRGGARPG